MEETGTLSPVVEVQIKYRKPLRYGETASVTTWIERYDGVRIIYGYEIRNQQGDLCAQATTTNTCVKKESFRPIAMKRAHPDWHKAYAAAAKN